MNTDENFYKELEAYPELKETLSIMDLEERFKYLIKLRENGVPDNLYGAYLRFCIQMNTFNVPLDILRKAFEGVSREMIMYDEELEAFSLLPEKITIYRGTDYYENPPRISWSLLEEKARWFYNGQMFKAEIPKDLALAYFKSNSSEEEIIIFLDSCYDVIY